LTLTANAQPAILCHSIALLRVLESEYGFKVKNCTYAMGHSLGEYSALVATDAISLSDAIRLVRLRGEAMQESISNKQTAMSALMISGDNLAEIEEMMPRLARSLGNGEVVEIANINSKSQVLIVNEIVLSGTQNGVKYACSVFQSKGLAGRSLPLPVSAPFHCSLMSNAAEIMGPALEKIQFKMPSIDVISNVTARPVLFH
jgi:[acyl-carrier-protein] S-malonyltransferase